ncbi:MAG: hypothetical protein BGO98_47910 [Myxococcales bacterium 68-20]|nr:MAG: hypothetical protein BGO98_47910 [Myxococcales bacterium 68-20]
MLALGDRAARRGLPGTTGALRWSSIRLTSRRTSQSLEQRRPTWAEPQGCVRACCGTSRVAAVRQGRCRRAPRKAVFHVRRPPDPSPAREARTLHPSDAMSARAHLGLRLSGLLLLLAVTVWPRSRGEHHDRAVAGVATPAHLAVTTAARLEVDEAPRPRAARAADDSDDGDLDAPVVEPDILH